MPAKSSNATGLTCPTTATSAMCETSAPTSSQADFLASLSASPGSSEARKMTVTSGRKCAELLRRRDPLGCLARTCLESSAWNSTACFLTWKISATPAGRLLCRLVPSMPDTDETVFGLWPTPEALNQEGYQVSGGKKYPRLGAMAKMWPTPTKQDGENNAPPSQWERNTPPLNVAVKMWPTPMSYSHGPDSNPPGISKLDCAVRPELHKHLWATPTKEGFDAGAHRGVKDTLYSQVGGQLNPEWVEWLMGYPIGHTDSKDSETPSSRKSQRTSSAGCSKAK